jgi:hypothetical protein
MSDIHQGSGGDERLRVRWTPRARRSWCPGAARARADSTESAPSGWTSYLHWQSVLGVVRERLRREHTASDAVSARATEPKLPVAPPVQAKLESEPPSALPSRRVRELEHGPALQSWLEETPQ